MGCYAIGTDVFFLAPFMVLPSIGNKKDVILVAKKKLFYSAVVLKHYFHKNTGYRVIHPICLLYVVVQIICCGLNDLLWLLLWFSTNISIICCGLNNLLWSE